MKHFKMSFIIYLVDHCKKIIKYIINICCVTMLEIIIELKYFL